MARSDGTDLALGVLDLLGGMYSSYKDSETQLDIAELDIEQRRDQREHELSKVYLANQLQKEDTLFQYKLQQEDKAAELGITLNELKGVSNINATLGTKFITDRSAEDIASNIESLQGEIDTTRDQLSRYYSGHTMARNIDTNIDGIVSDAELTDYLEETGTALTPEFKLGVKSYTARPEQLLALQASQLEIESNQIKNKWLGKSLKQEFDLNEISIKGGRKNLQKMDFDLTQAEKDIQIADQTIKQNSLNLIKLEDEVNISQINRDVEQMTKLSNTFGEMSVQNKEAQTSLGIMALSQIQWGDADEFKSLYTLISFEDMTDLKSSVKKMGENKELSLIAGDVVNMYKNVSQAKADPIASNYSGFLSQVVDQNVYKDELYNFIDLNYAIVFEKEMEGEYRGLTASHIWQDASLMDEFMKRTIGYESSFKDGNIMYDNYSYQDIGENWRVRTGNETPIYSDLAPIWKGFQWYKTGLYDNPELLRQIDTIVSQEKALESNIEMLGIRRADILNQTTDEITKSLNMFYMRNIPQRGN